MWPLGVSWASSQHVSRTNSEGEPRGSQTAFFGPSWGSQGLTSATFTMAATQHCQVPCRPLPAKAQGGPGRRGATSLGKSIFPGFSDGTGPRQAARVFPNLLFPSPPHCTSGRKKPQHHPAGGRHSGQASGGHGATSNRVAETGSPCGKPPDLGALGKLAGSAAPQTRNW